MENLKLKSYAKINIGLDILDKREDGYHNIKSIMQEIDLYDEMEISQSDNIEIVCSNSDLKTDESNIIHKSILEIQKFTNTSYGLKVTLKKNIPMMAGLGGGSSNGATTLKAYNTLYDLKLTNEELIKIASNVGADVPFFILGGACLCEGIGEILTPINIQKDIFAVLIKPDLNISTKEAYLTIDKIGRYLRPSRYDDTITGLNTYHGSVPAINSFMLYTDEYYPVINDIMRVFFKNRAIFALMSGSGSTVYGLYYKEDVAQKAYAKLSRLYNEVYIAKFI